ncbi:CHASE2 domain-containing protein [bacterium]|nr:CHASE2 domain-containing protein [bacterium]MDB9953721.1 CHASE2 domain-containing protein [Porticoccaceae bacterium]
MKPQEITERSNKIGAWLAARHRALILALSRWAHSNHLANQFKAAVFVASLVMLVNEFQLLERLRTDFLRLSLAITSDLKPAVLEDSALEDSASAPEIVVVLLDDLDYETQFGQASPLNRHLLSDMISNLLGGVTPPKVLAIDFDLSPSPKVASAKDSPGSGYTADEEKLYCMLGLPDSNNAADCPKPQQKKPPNLTTKIVLITPQPVFYPDLVSRKVDWMAERCKRGIQFGLPEIMYSQGLVMEYQVSGISLINEVARAADSIIPGTRNRICGDSNLQRSLVEKNAPRADKSLLHTETKLLNFNFDRHINLLDYRQLCPTKGVCDVTGLANKVVFFGGHYGVSDIYDTPIGKLSGVQLHGASYYSLLHDVPEVVHSLGYLIEILFGTLIGISFFRLACSFRHRQSLMGLLLNMSMQPLVLLVALFINGYLLRFHNITFNLAPLAFGMAIHVAFVRLESEQMKPPDDSVLFFGIKDSGIKTALYWITVGLGWYFVVKHSMH